jgi:hypothetical protein
MLHEGPVLARADEQGVGQGCEEEAVRTSTTSSRSSANISSYRNIHIVGYDSPAQLKKYKLKHGSRLKLLRRTLRERKVMASYVHELRVPDLDIPHLLPNGKRNVQYEEYRDLVASIVMACPNLERLTGFHKPYNHEFDRLTHALSTRRNLKEHMWIITENASVTARSHYRLPPGLLDDHQVYQFLQFHSNWLKLETLLLYSPGPAGIIEHDVFVRTLRLLPSLRHLCVSSFDADDFTDATLDSLPPLKSLRLEALPGITDAGLTSYASNTASTSLRSLTLVHQNLDSLLAICKLLSSLTVLDKFTLVQHPCPALPMGLLIIQPLLASPSLKHLHWDISSPPPPNPDTFFGPSLPPNAHLAHSILAGGFPSLETLRCPSDICPPGALQAVCRPTLNAQILLTSDKYSLPPSAPRGLSAFATTASSRNNIPAPLGPGSSLQLARKRAQTLIDSTTATSKAARPGDFIRVVVTDHSGPVHDPTKLILDTAVTPIASPSSSIMSPPTDRRSPIMPSAATIHQNSLPPRMASPPVSNPSNPASPIITNSPPGSPTQPKPHTEVAFPRFLGRMDPLSTHPPPEFVLTPDIPGNDADGGVVGFADLLNNSAAGGTRRKEGIAWYVRDGCTGTWNQSNVSGRAWWGHVERERGTEPGVGMMF